MLSRTANKIFRCTYYQMMTKCRSTTLASSETENETDPAPLFFDKETQQMLRKLTRIDYNKVSRLRREGQKVKVPEYKLMTDEELQQVTQEAVKRLEKRLQMPPVVKAWRDETEVISVEPALQGSLENKLVCTDISYGIKNQERIIVVRETDGTLRTARPKERARVNNVYFPVKGRELETPKVFCEEQFVNLLNRKEYEYLLDRACTQFEPDDPEYINITHIIYLNVNATKSFELLRSTRHFGPMVFYLTQIKKIDDLLVDIINGGKIDEAAVLIRFYHKCHPAALSATEKCDGDDVALIEHYARLDSLNPSIVTKAINTYKELEREKQIVQENIRKAHGLDANPEEV